MCLTEHASMERERDGDREALHFYLNEHGGKTGESHAGYSFSIVMNTGEAESRAGERKMRLEDARRDKRRAWTDGWIVDLICPPA